MFFLGWFKPNNRTKSEPNSPANVELGDDAVSAWDAPAFEPREFEVQEASIVRRIPSSLHLIFITLTFIALGTFIFITFIALLYSLTLSGVS